MLSAGADDHLAAQHLFQHIGLLAGTPAFEGQVGAGQAGNRGQEQAGTVEVGRHAFHGRRVAPIEAIGYPQDSREPLDDILVVLVQAGELLMLAPGTPAAMVPADQRDQVALPGIEIEPLGVHDELIAVAMMPAVAHHLADIVK